MRGFHQEATVTSHIDLAGELAALVESAQLAELPNWGYSVSIRRQSRAFRGGEAARATGAFIVARLILMGISEGDFLRASGAIRHSHEVKKQG